VSCKKETAGLGGPESALVRTVVVLNKNVTLNQRTARKVCGATNRFVGGFFCWRAETGGERETPKKRKGPEKKGNFP